MAHDWPNSAGCRWLMMTKEKFPGSRPWSDLAENWTWGLGRGPAGSYLALESPGLLHTGESGLEEGGEDQQQRSGARGGHGWSEKDGRWGDWTHDHLHQWLTVHCTCVTLTCSGQLLKRTAADSRLRRPALLWLRWQDWNERRQSCHKTKMKFEMLWGSGEELPSC